VENRTGQQLLARALDGKTRSWFMVEPADASTRLYFGSAVVPTENPRTGRREMGLAFKLLLGFHKLYSRRLLGAAARRVARA